MSIPGVTNEVRVPTTVVTPHIDHEYQPRPLQACSKYTTYAYVNNSKVSVYNYYELNLTWSASSQRPEPITEWSSYTLDQSSSSKKLVSPGLHTETVFRKEQFLDVLS